MGPTAAIGNGCQCWTCRRHWTTRPVPGKSRRQRDRASWGGRWGLHGQPLPSESNQIASWKPFRAADLTRRDNSHNRHMHTEYCHLPYGKSSAAVPYVDIVCSIRLNAIRCKSDARFGLSQALLRWCRCPFLFFFASGRWQKEDSILHFSGGRGDYTGPVEKLSSTAHCPAQCPRFCCRLGLAGLTHGMAWQGRATGAILYGLWTT